MLSAGHAEAVLEAEHSPVNLTPKELGINLMLIGRRRRVNHVDDRFYRLARAVMGDTLIPYQRMNQMHVVLLLQQMTGPLLIRIINKDYATFRYVLAMVPKY